MEKYQTKLGGNNYEISNVIDLLHSKNEIVGNGKTKKEPIGSNAYRQLIQVVDHSLLILENKWVNHFHVRFLAPKLN